MGGFEKPIRRPDSVLIDMPRQARKPCSGWGRRSMTCSHKAAVAGPIRLASARILSIVQFLQRRWLDGIWSSTVVWP
jgi:hypothetical protein